MGKSKKINLTDETILCEKYQRGCSVTELADEYQVSRNTIKNYLKRFGLWKKGDTLKVDIREERVYQLLSSSKSAVELSKELNCSLDTIRRKRLEIKGLKDVPLRKRMHYVSGDIKGGKKVKRKYECKSVEFEGKRYLDVTNLITNMNDWI